MSLFHFLFYSSSLLLFSSPVLSLPFFTTLLCHFLHSYCPFPSLLSFPSVCHSFSLICLFLRPSSTLSFLSHPTLYPFPHSFIHVLFPCYSSLLLVFLPTFFCYHSLYLIILSSLFFLFPLLPHIDSLTPLFCLFSLFHYICLFYFVFPSPSSPLSLLSSSLHSFSSPRFSSPLCWVAALVAGDNPCHGG